jgi:hypothetical protein
MSCVNYEQDQEEGHYHFALAEIVYYISQYGIDSVMTDIYDYIEVEKQKKLTKARGGYLNPALRTYDGKLEYEDQ